MESQPTKKMFYTKWWSWVILALFIFFVSASNKSPQTATPATATNPPTSSNSTAADKAKAQKELDNFMQLTEKARVVKSYEFSKTANLVYIDNIWYSQTVQFKKDFLAKIAMLKKTITGYTYFEVRDAYSNEKVAEVTAFSSSLEVYK